MSQRQVRIHNEDTKAQAVIQESSLPVYLDRGWTVIDEEQKLPNESRPSIEKALAEHPAKASVRKAAAHPQ